MVAAQSQSLVSADRLPSEQLVVGYDSSAKHKDFNKIYTDVTKKMEIKNIQRVKERCGESGWKKELKRMKIKARRRGSEMQGKVKKSPFKAPSTFSSQIRFDKDEDKKKLGVMHPGKKKQILFYFYDIVLFFFFFLFFFIFHVLTLI